MKFFWMVLLVVWAPSAFAQEVSLLLELGDDVGNAISTEATVEVVLTDGTDDLSCEQFTVTFVGGVAGVLIGALEGSACQSLPNDLSGILEQAFFAEVTVSEVGGPANVFSFPLGDVPRAASAVVASSADLLAGRSADVFAIDGRRIYVEGGSTRAEIDQVIAAASALGPNANNPVVVELGAGSHNWAPTPTIFPGHVTVRGQGPLATRINGLIEVSGTASVQDLGLDAGDEAGRIISLIALGGRMNVSNVDILGTTSTGGGAFRTGIGLSGDLNGLLSQVNISNVTINLQSDLPLNGVFINVRANNGVPLVKLDDLTIRTVGSTSEPIVINELEPASATALIAMSDVVILGNGNPAIRQNSSIRVSISNLQQTVTGLSGFGGTGTGQVSIQGSQIRGRFDSSPVPVFCSNVFSVDDLGTPVNCATP